jgi:hypothetical protein
MEIVQRDDGLFALGWHDDAPGPFLSRRHARDAWLRQTRRDDRWVRQ